jgi:hypothetical protein
MTLIRLVNYNPKYAVNLFITEFTVIRLEVFPVQYATQQLCDAMVNGLIVWTLPLIRENVVI